jgi:hypothetical protein
MAEEEFYDGLDSFEEEMFQTALVRGEKQPAFGTSQLVVPPPPLPDSQEDTFVSAHDDDESAPHEPSAATSPPPTTVAAEGGAAQAGAAAGVDVAGGGAVRAGAAAGGGAVQVVPPKRLRASGGLKGNKRQQGGAFMAEVTGNATGHRPILTAAEVALHDKLASEYGESNHAAIAAAFTHEANLVAADMTRLLWPKFERHIKLFQRERDEQHQLKRQGLTRSVFSLIKVTVSWKLTRNHSKVLKLS